MVIQEDLMKPGILEEFARFSMCGREVDRWVHESNKLKLEAAAPPLTAYKCPHYHHALDG